MKMVKFEVRAPALAWCLFLVVRQNFSSVVMCSNTEMAAVLVCSHCNRHCQSSQELTAHDE